MIVFWTNSRPVLDVNVNVLNQRFCELTHAIVASFFGDCLGLYPRSGDLPYVFKCDQPFVMVQ